jgi:murein DD-endopeptidase MepM/ murein hydrolase activator NlpD
MNAKAWIGIALAGVLLFCALPLVAILSDTEPASACGPNPGGRSAQATVREHVGAVGRWKSGQVDNAAIIVAVGQQRRVPARGWVIAVATAMTESSLTNHGDLGPRNDHDSLGLFQQRPSMGWGTPQQVMDPVYASTKFYHALLKVKNWETLPLTVAAQKVQRSGFPDRYAEYENDAEAVVAKVTGAASITELPGASLADCATTPTVVTSGGWTRPVDAGIVSGFRTSERPKHQGVDLGAKRYTVIRAASAGKVVWANCDDDTGNCNVDGSPTTPGCGWFVEILHSGKIGTRYCHMVRRPDVAYGQHVNAGDALGLVGTSGHSSGPHLHFEVHTGVTCGRTRCRLTSSNATNPEVFMRNVGAQLGEKSS